MLSIRSGSIVLVVLLFVATLTSNAVAQDCKSEVVRDSDGRIRLVVNCQGSPGSGGGSAPSARKCYSGGRQVPCRTDQGSWYSPRQCYISRVSPQPPRSDPSWQGHADGTLYYCRISGQAIGSATLIWLASAAPPPDPEVLARRAVASMRLRPFRIGIVPEDRPDRVGLVGMPVWLWAENPGPQTFGPITRSASSGGYTVRATAKVTRVRWSLGDGATRTCSGPGTPYLARFGKAESPTCGYRYSQQGEYTVRAESQWVVSWSGIGESGTIRLSLADSTRIAVGELQVVTVNAEG